MGLETSSVAKIQDMVTWQRKERSRAGKSEDEPKPSKSGRSTSALAAGAEMRRPMMMRGAH